MEPPIFFRTHFITALFLVMLWPQYTRAQGPYQVHNLSEQEILQTYTQMLRDACHGALREWKTSSFDPAAGYWGDGASAGNEGTRTVASMVLACGTLLKYDDALSDSDRRDLLAEATAALRYCTATHVTGPQKCPDGKHWGATDKFGGESWQSGMWTGTFAFGAWQLMCQGSLALPGLHFGIARHAINAEQASYGLIAHKVFGPAVEPITAQAAAAKEQGARDYPYVDFIAHRTDKKFASFSWKNRIMGLLMPIGEGHEDNPNFTVPIPSGFVGSFLQFRHNTPDAKVLEHSRKTTPDGFETDGTLLTNAGKLKQTLRMISLGSQSVVYADRVTAVSDDFLASELGVPLGIENDEITGGVRVVTNQDGQIKFDWKKPQKSVALKGSWANVDGRIGMVVVQGSGMTYAPASKYSPGIAVYSDILYGSYSDHARQFKAGDEVANRIVILFVEVTPEQTSALAKSCKIETTPGGRVLHFRQPDGKDTEVPLP